MIYNNIGGEIMANKNQFITGITDLLVLSVLNKKDSYVYEIVKSIEELSDGQLVISQNTVYTATYKLANEGIISEYSKLVGKKRTRLYYHLEPSGKEALQALFKSYQNMTDGVIKILNNLKK
jgi:PadR family transcriptional regulator PadR